MFTRIAYALTVPFRTLNGTLNGAIAPHGRARGERVPGERARRRSALWNSPGGHRRGERDRAGGDEALDVGRRDADLAEDLGRVLAEQRRGAADGRGRGGGAHGKAEHPGGAVAGLLDLGDGLEVLDLRIGEDLVELVDGPGRDRRALEALLPLGGGGAGEGLLDAGAELVVMGQPRVVRGEARIARERGVERRAAAPLRRVPRPRRE